MSKLSPEDQGRLDYLNQAIEDAIRERTSWLDSKMEEYADLQIGDDIYNLNSGKKAGVVTALYRLNSGRRRDGYMEVNYKFETSPNCFDNTSRQPGVLGSKPEAVKRAGADFERLKAS